jgi:hypothetical protein
LEAVLGAARMPLLPPPHFGFLLMKTENQTKCS